MKITFTTSDDERFEILKDAIIQAPVYDGSADEIVSENLSDLESGKKSAISAALKKLVSILIFTENTKTMISILL